MSDATEAAPTAQSIYEKTLADLKAKRAAEKLAKEAKAKAKAKAEAAGTTLEQKAEAGFNSSGEMNVGTIERGGTVQSTIGAAPTTSTRRLTKITPK